MADKVVIADTRNKKTRKSYPREFKLAVVRWYYENGKNISRTSLHFEVDRKQVRNWLKNESVIRKQKSKSKTIRGRKAQYPLVETKLLAEFKEQRKRGKIVKKWWFLSRSRTLMTELYPNAKDFKLSDRWFSGFLRRNKLTLRRKTHVAQKPPAQLRKAIEKFHAKLLRERMRGIYTLGDIANMDQTPLPFVLDDGTTYDKKGSKEVWAVSGSSDLEKRQCTVQLTIFGDGVSRVRPTIIFRGKGKRINAEERKKWDRRVKVYFQPNAWCDENVMKEWTSDEWGNLFSNPPTAGSSGKILIADVQQTDAVKHLLHKKKTVLVNVPPGCTSRVQPLDVSVNKPFKNYVREEFEKHLDDNLERYVEGKIGASERRVLTTKWVANAWEKVTASKECVIRSFVKCGLTNNLDGTEDKQINIRGIDDYTMPQPEEEFHLETSSEEEDDGSGDNVETATSSESEDNGDSESEDSEESGDE